MPAVAHKTFEFKGFTLDLTRGSLSAADGEIELRPKSFAVLRYLVENAGRLLPKEEILAAIWPDVTVTEEALTHCVSDVRRALGDREQRTIRTIPRRGYLFAATVLQPESALVPAVTTAATVGAYDACQVRGLPLPNKPSIAVLPSCRSRT